ncbi:kinase-like protein [Lizonia empirigonia]|nr:kinase-like protein [Lizonia empirigonia]
MLLNRLAYHISPTSRIGIRMASTIVGKSGRVYIQREVLQECEDPRLNVFKADHFGSHDQSFVFKRVSKPCYDLSLRLAADFPESRRLRMHVDLNEDENVLIYPYYQHTLLGLLQEDSKISDAARKIILQQTGEAIQELHSKDWIHIDIKPDNILVNWTCDEEGTKTITNVALGDFDIASKLETGALLQTTHAVGDAMWRSPEGQTGRGLSKASDIYSFGLVCIYTLGAGEVLLINDYQDLVKLGISPEQEILTRHFSYFGSADEGLLNQVASEKWTKALKLASQMAELALGSEAQKMISGMTKPDPTARSTINQVVAHPWW